MFQMKFLNSVENSDKQHWVFMILPEKAIKNY